MTFSYAIPHLQLPKHHLFLTLPPLSPFSDTPTPVLLVPLGKDPSSAFISLHICAHVCTDTYILPVYLINFIFV